MKFPDTASQDSTFTALRDRVEYLATLLRQHRELALPRSKHWEEKERELIHQLAEAQVALEGSERYLAA